MKKIAVVFKSNYGTSMQYAAWIAKDLNADLLDYKNIKPKHLKKYDCVVYGGGLYAGKINGVNLVKKAAPKQLVLFVVGLVPSDSTNQSEMMEKALSGLNQENIKAFYFQGAMEFKKLSLIHRMMINFMKKMVIGKKSYEELTEEEKIISDSCTGKVDFINYEFVKPLVEYVRQLQLVE